MIPTALLFITPFFFFLKLINFNACSLKDSQNFLMQSLPLYRSCFVSMLLNDDIVEIERPGTACSLAFVMNEFSGLFLHPSMFFIKYSWSSKKQIFLYQIFNID